MANLTIYGTPVSTYVRTVRLLLEEAGADYDLKGVNIFTGESKAAEYLSKNPFGKIPTLEVDGEVLYETSAIIGYLDQTVANQKFTPANPLLQARMRQIMAIIDNYLYSPVISSIVIQRLVMPSQGKQPNEGQISAAIAPAKKAIEAIESIAVGSPYLLGNEISIADFYLIPIFGYLLKTPEFETIAAQTPNLRNWWAEVSQLPNVKKVCA